MSYLIKMAKLKKSVVIIILLILAIIVFIFMNKREKMENQKILLQTNIKNIKL